MTVHEVGTPGWLDTFDDRAVAATVRRAARRGGLAVGGAVASAVGVVLGALGLPRVVDALAGPRLLLLALPVVLLVATLGFVVQWRLWRRVARVVRREEPPSSLAGAGRVASRAGGVTTLAAAASVVAGLLLPVGDGWDASWARLLLPAVGLGAVGLLLSLWVTPSLTPVEVSPQPGRG